MDEKKSNAGRDLSLFLAGGLIGAGLALLFAPQSGRKTRRDIRHIGKVALNKSEAIRLELQHAADNAVTSIGERLSEEIDRGREWTENAKNQFFDALESGKGYIRREIEKITHG